jgi:hypothetical protein
MKESDKFRSRKNIMDNCKLNESIIVLHKGTVEIL